MPGEKEIDEFVKRLRADLATLEERQATGQYLCSVEINLTQGNVGRSFIEYKFREPIKLTQKG